MDKTEKARFEEFLNSCDLSRHYQLEEDFQKGRDISELTKQCETLYEKLSNALPPDQLSILVEYADALNEIGMQRGFFFYKSGFTDASQLIQILLGNKNNLRLNIAII